MMGTCHKAQIAPETEALDNGPGPKNREKASGVWIGFIVAIPVSQAMEQVKVE